MTIKKSRLPFAYTTTIVIALVIFFGLYGLLRAKEFIRGPNLSIASPQDGAEIHDTDLEIRGSAKNISNISLNGRQIFTNNEGEFKEHLLLPLGYTIIEVKASDRFGREVSLRRGVTLSK